MKENIDLLNAVINTLNRVVTDNTEGNWDKIHMCQKAIGQVIGNLKELDENTEVISLDEPTENPAE